MESEHSIRVQLAALFRLIAHFGWDDLIFTHASARIPGGDHRYLINPYDRMFHEMTASSLVAVDETGKPAGESAQPVNPTAFTIHGAVHAARADALCVIHVHTTAGIAVSTHADGLMPLNQTAILLNDRIAYHEYEGVAERPDECARIVADLGNKDVMILRNHGLMAVGASIPEAFLRLYVLQRACENQVATLSGNPALHRPASHLQEERQVFEIDQAVVAKLAWEPLIRMLVAQDPTFQT